MKSLVLAVVLGAMMAFAGRTVVDLSGKSWICDGEAVTVPHTWNAVDGADGSPTGEPPPKHGMSISPDTYVRNPVTGLYHKMNAEVDEYGNITLVVEKEGVVK